LSVTACRLILRVRSGRIWWDDAWVLFSAFSNILMATATFLHYGPPYAYSLSTRLAAYYLIAEGFYLTLWTARLSILFSIIRIVPEKAQQRFLKRTAWAFGAVLIFLITQVFWVCETPKKRGWQKQPNPQCSLGLQVAVCQLITDIVADVLLILIPTRLLFQTTSLPRPLQIRLFIIFSATLLITVVGLVHAAYLLEVRGVDAIISALVEVSVCLIVCNGVVLLPALYRLSGLRADDVVDSSGNMPGERSYRISSFRFRRGRTTRGATTAGGMTEGLTTGAGAVGTISVGGTDTLGTVGWQSRVGGAASQATGTTEEAIQIELEAPMVEHQSVKTEQKEGTGAPSHTEEKEDLEGA